MVYQRASALAGTRNTRKYKISKFTNVGLLLVIEQSYAPWIQALIIKFIPVVDVNRSAQLRKH